MSLDESLKAHQSAVIPMKAVEIIGQFESESIASKVNVSSMIKSLKKFDPKSHDIENFNDELLIHATRLRSIQAKMAENNTERTLKQLQSEKAEVMKM